MTDIDNSDKISIPAEDGVIQADESNSSGFFSETHVEQSPLKNKKIVSFLDVFIPDIRHHLESFLSCKMQITLESVNLCNTREDAFAYNSDMLTSFHCSPVNQYGVLCYSFNLLNIIVNLLYGSTELGQASSSRLGKTGVRISEKLTFLCLSSIQQGLQEFLQVALKAESTTNEVNLITNKFLPAYYFELTFKLSIQGNEGKISVIIPETIFNYYSPDSLPGEAPSYQELRFTAGDKHRKEIIDSSITLVACLQDVKMKIGDVLNLKSGDLIPIKDPNYVSLFHHDKPLFEGSMGQVDSNRVIKISHSS